MVRMEPTADDSLAAMRARSKFGIAIAAIIRMIATTISSSISEKPFCFRISFFPLVRLGLLVMDDPVAFRYCICPSKIASYLGFGLRRGKRFLFSKPSRQYPQAQLAD